MVSGMKELVRYEFMTTMTNEKSSPRKLKQHNMVNIFVQHIRATWKDWRHTRNNRQPMRIGDKLESLLAINMVQNSKYGAYAL
jgi:hypothetical protein